MSKENKSVKIAGEKYVHDMAAFGGEIMFVKDAPEPEKASATEAAESGELGNPKLDSKPSGPSRRE